jgi:hypothetical protein
VAGLDAAERVGQVQGLAELVSGGVFRVHPRTMRI